MRALLVVLLLWVAPAAAHAQSVRDVAARVHEQGGYGERLRVGPGGGGPGITYGGGGSGARDRGDRANPDRRARSPERSPGTIALPAGSAAFSYALMAIAIVVIVGLIVMVLVRSRPQGGALAPARTERDRGPRLSGPSPSPLTGRSVDLDADPDALAAEGRFADAIAAALVRGLLAVGWRPEGHGKSRTAREILASVGSADQRRVLGELVSIEERIAFGGDEATRERWERARAEWRSLDGSSA